ncbi:hypothetical protein GCM10011575_40990 [Microlunatus endophyticus]|uniref:Uncharacterized protein n=1 Tax=Microlunatus endophyticus TaxID=1716077 RepID=A0A917SF98_9ACTN|nr:hypothetical protein [Microlunatus endophyticus]GGL78463.1 hypothetical protein GCM10011575_40990 [Microlunatus endophyticus]
MESFVLLLVLIVVGGSALLYNRKQANRREAARQAELESQLSVSKRAADEDVTKFGEELQRLDVDVAGRPLDEAMQQDYQRALDAYEDAKTSLAAVRRPEEIRHVTEILEDGRYGIACVKARVANQPLPQKRPPCFFNPAHGPSTQNVRWAPPGGSVREVPACAADAERVTAGADPYIRTVQMGARRVPYWEGGPVYAPWAQGYYSSWRGSDMVTGMMVGGLLFGGMNSMGGLFSGLGNGIGAIGEGVGEGLEGIGDGIGDAFDGIGTMFGDIFGDN